MLHKMAIRFCNLSCQRLLLITCLLIVAMLYTLKVYNKRPDFQYIRQSERYLDLNVNSQAQLGQACMHPELDLWNPVLREKYTKIKPLECFKNEEDWVYVSNGSMFISKTAEKDHGEVVCECFPLKWISDYEVGYENSIKALVNGTPLVTDFFEVTCIGKDGAVYNNLHSGVHRSPELQKPDVNLNKNSLGLNILMIGFDSVSRMTWQRNLPKTYKYLVDTLGGFVLEGYNIVGDGTPRALIPILTGKTELELPEARRGHPDAVPVDNHPWIWRDLKKLGYVTQWGEDETRIATFEKRMLGFKYQPVDHNIRTFYLKSEPRYHKERPNCLGSIPRHRIMLNYIKELYQVYPHKPKFSFLFHVEYSHYFYNRLKWADDDLTDFMEFMDTQGYLENTVLILMSDHGPRFNTVRQTVQGKYEERMPFVSFRFPPKFHKEHPDVIENVRKNTLRLTTPFDIHATFQDIINFTGAGMGSVKNRGISLFKEIPLERTCEHAGIEPHWCTCLNWIDLSAEDNLVQRAVSHLLQTINNITDEHRSDCVELSLSKVMSAAKFSPGNRLLQFQKYSDKLGRNPVFSDDAKVPAIWYQVSIVTKPGLGSYEATVKYLPTKDQFVGNMKEISRTNVYGNQPHCIMGKFPNLYEFCYCHKQLAA